MASRQHREAHLLDRRARSLVGHAGVSVAVEDDRSGEPRRDPAVEVDHALGALRRIVASGVDALVLPAVGGARPSLRGRILNVQRLLHIITHHPLGIVVIQGSRQAPIKCSGIRVEVKLIDVRAIPALRDASRRRGQEAAPHQPALLVQAGDGRDGLQGWGCCPAIGLALPVAARHERRVSGAAVVPEEVKVRVGQEAVLVRVPQHVHGHPLRLYVGAGVSHGNARHLDLRRVEEDLLCERRDVHACIRLAGDVELVRSQLRELVPEEVLQSCASCARGSDVRVLAAAPRAHCCTIGVADTSRTLQDQQVCLLRPRIWVPHEPSSNIDEQGTMLLQHAQDGAAAGPPVQPQHHRHGGGCRRLRLGKPVVQHGPWLRSGGIEEAGPLR
mmetsp:Transcript_52797/g.153580  ORF Transcript_52797/g.153580 Transcript_52797/m.153580 type:complete len:387 (+) Transcript_52797:489-1649(+)